MIGYPHTVAASRDQCNEKDLLPEQKVGLTAAEIGKVAVEAMHETGQSRLTLTIGELWEITGQAILQALSASEQAFEDQTKRRSSDKRASEAFDTVERPRHYNMGRFEVIDVIEDWKLNFHRGNALKYIARAGHKGHEIEDLRKALWYLNREIQRLEQIEAKKDSTP